MNDQKLEQIIEETKSINLDINNSMLSLITDENVKLFSLEYIKNNKYRNELGFNIFGIISDAFYKENFHSDIIKAFLEIPEIFDEFIKLLNKKKPALSLYSKDYNNFIVEREKDRIDISIKDPLSKKAIIIENKINNAGDMEQQIPRYYNKLVNEGGYEVEAVIYLSLDGKKTPYTGDWTKEDKEEIFDRLILLSAYTEPSEDDIYSMLQSCEDLIVNIDVLLLIRQYKQLIKYLGRNIVNKPIMEKFLQIALQDDNYDTIVALTEMFNDLPKYRVIRLRDYFENKHNPFKEVDIWKEYTFFFNDLSVKKSDFALDVYCENDEYSVQFFDRNAPENNNKTALDFIKNFNYKFVERKQDRRIYMTFKFPEEEKKLYDFLDEFLNKLKAYVNN